MAATWPLAPRSAALLGGPSADAVLLSSRQIPWIDGDDPAVDELLLSFNNGGSSACSLAATTAHIAAIASADSDDRGGTEVDPESNKAVGRVGSSHREGRRRQAASGSAPVRTPNPTGQHEAPSQAARSRSGSNASAKRHDQGRPLWKVSGQESGSERRTAQVRQRRQRSGSPNVSSAAAPLPDLAEIRKVLEDAVATSRISSQPPSNLERTRLNTSGMMSAGHQDDHQRLQRSRQELEQGPSQPASGSRLRPPRLPAALSTRLNRIGQQGEVFSPSRPQPQPHSSCLQQELSPSEEERSRGGGSASSALPALPLPSTCTEKMESTLTPPRNKTKSKRKCASDAVLDPGPQEQHPVVEPEEAYLGPSLRCHMLFSSPLCLERPVVVQLPCNFLRQRCSILSSMAEAEVAAWSLDFEQSCPAVVRSVQSGGLIANWNAEQQHVESMVRPGDALMRVSISGVQEFFRGRTPADVIGDLLSKVDLDRLGPTPYLELVFCALRAIPALKVSDELEVIRSSGCEVVARGATAQNMRGLIASADCRILHLSLHCSVAQEQLLFLEDPHGKAHVIRAGDIKGLLLQGQQQQTIGLVVVNACHSLALGAHFVDAGVRHVVCVRNDREVRDESCRLFARDFFSALRAGRCVQEAFECGRAVLAHSNQQHHQHDAASFILLPEGGDHSETFACQGGARPALPRSVEGGTWGSLLPPVEDFQGREADMHRILVQVHSRRFVEVQGEEGIGKTTFLTEIGRFLLLRSDLFDEVRWIESCESTTHAESNAGLEGLRNRLTYESPTRRVLLLIDDPRMFRRAPLQPLLRFGGVHVMLASVPGSPVPAAESDISAGTDLVRTAEIASRTAVAAGLKPVMFQLGPLEPLAQVRLFLQRAARPLYMCELQCQPPSAADVQQRELTILQPPQRPVEYLQLAGMPLFADLQGNPRRIVDAAVRLAFVTEEPRLPANPDVAGPTSPKDVTRPIAPPGTNGMRALSADSSAGPREHLPVSGTRRRVRLTRPDGRTKDEWLPRRAAIRDILEEHSPQALRGEAEIFISGCRAPSEALISDFPDDKANCLLILEFRRREEDVW